jgi:hypothetical protein
VAEAEFVPDPSALDLFYSSDEEDREDLALVASSSEEDQAPPGDLDGFAPEVFAPMEAEGEADSTPMVGPQPAASSAGPDLVAQEGPLTSDTLEAEASQPPVLGGPRAAAAHVLVVPGGKISYYGAQFQVATALCCNRDHGKCVITRTMAAGRRPGQGRPLGFFMAWLAMGSECGTKEEHWDRARWPSLTARQHGRQVIAAMDHPDAHGLLSAERALEPGEDPEPIDIV